MKVILTQLEGILIATAVMVGGISLDGIHFCEPARGSVRAISESLDNIQYLSGTAHVPLPIQLFDRYTLSFS